MEVTSCIMYIKLQGIVLAHVCVTYCFVLGNWMFVWCGAGRGVIMSWEKVELDNKGTGIKEVNM